MSGLCLFYGEEADSKFSSVGPATSPRWLLAAARILGHVPAALPFP